MAISTTPIKILGKNVKTSEKKCEGWQGKEVCRSSLKEWEQKAYPQMLMYQKCQNNCQNAQDEINRIARMQKTEIDRES